jgi:hypothetical protein
MSCAPLSGLPPHVLWGGCEAMVTAGWFFAAYALLTGIYIVLENGRPKAPLRLNAAVPCPARHRPCHPRPVSDETGRHNPHSALTTRNRVAIQRGASARYPNLMEDLREAQRIKYVQRYTWDDRFMRSVRAACDGSRYLPCIA